MAPIDLTSTLVPDELTRRADRLLERRRKQVAFRDPDKRLENYDFDFNFNCHSGLRSGTRPLAEQGVPLRHGFPRTRRYATAATGSAAATIHRPHVITWRHLPVPPGATL